MINKKTIIQTLIVFALLVCSYSVLYIFKITWIEEDGFFESTGALLYLFASIIMIILFIKSGSGNNFFLFRTRRNIFFLLLGLLFFFCFGEEISWGQRIFNVETPEKIKEINSQGEINVHNLFFFHGLDENDERKEGIEVWYSLGRLFSLFWFLLCCLIPFMGWISKRILKFWQKINLPLAPLWLGGLFIFNYIASKAIERTIGYTDNQPIVEIKETNIAFLFFVFSLMFYLSYRKNIKHQM